jgi:CBS domain-containing protein
LIGLGLIEFLAGSLVGGVWMVFIGWFLLTAAREEETSIRTRQSLDGFVVADVMTAHPHTAPGWISVEEFIGDYLLGDRHSSYPVARADGTIAGLITLTQLRGVPPAQRATTSVDDAALPLDRVPTARTTEPVTALIERLEPTARRRVLVMDDGGQVVGIVTASDIARLVEVRMLASPRPVA